MRWPISFFLDHFSNGISKWFMIYWRVQTVAVFSKKNDWHLKYFFMERDKRTLSAETKIFFTNFSRNLVIRWGQDPFFLLHDIFSSNEFTKNINSHVWKQAESIVLMITVIWDLIYQKYFEYLTSRCYSVLHICSDKLYLQGCVWKKCGFKAFKNDSQRCFNFFFAKQKKYK